MYSKHILRLLVVVITLIAIVQLFQILIRPERTRWANNTKKAEQSTLAALHKVLVDDKPSMTDDQKSVADFLSYSMCGLSGVTCTDKVDLTRMEGSIGYAIGNLVSLPLQHPPASGIITTQQTLANAGFIPKTYAQGIGFASLTSFQTIWKALRDVVFLIIVILIVITGFIVMFNIPVGGKTTVEIESVLPRLVITLIAISLSYAIAGFLVDLMYVLMFLVVSVFNPILPTDKSWIIGSIVSGKPNDFFGMMFSNGFEILWISSQSLYSVIPATFRYVIDSILFNLMSTTIVSSISGMNGKGKGVGTVLNRMWQGGHAVGNANIKGFEVPGGMINTLLNPGFSPLLTNLSTKILGLKSTVTGAEAAAGNLSILGNNVVGVIITLLRTIIIEPFMALFRSFVTIAVLFILVLIGFLLSIFKTFWLLFSTYVSIILQIMFAPIYIVLNVLPGNNGFVDWVKQLAILLLTFPLILTLLLVALFFMQSPDLNEMWVPPFVSGIASQKAIQAMIAGTLLFSIPTLIDKMRQSLGYKEGFSLSPISMISPVVGLIGGAMGSITSAGKLKQSISKAGWFGKIPGAGPSPDGG